MLMPTNVYDVALIMHLAIWVISHIQLSEVYYPSLYNNVS